jgi:hypothetical protein
MTYPGTQVIDPMRLKEALWPSVYFYDKQQEVIYSVRDNDETYCVAGHQLGKDFVAGFIVLWFFLAHKEVRIITTSVKDDHLRVLWGEIGRYVETARTDSVFGPLRAKDGGCLITKHREMRKLVTNQGRLVECKISYALGMVSEKGEGLAGHHAASTLLVVDEGSGVDAGVLDRCSSWAKRTLCISNPYGPPTSWLAKIVKAGDVEKQTTTA